MSNGAAFNRRAEVEALLATDETVLGNTWRYDRDGLTTQQMMEAEGVFSPAGSATTAP